jgi:multidrug efflux pump subunit AcrA (membrane-fusion protein)
VLSWRQVDIDGDLGDRIAISTGLAEGDEVVAAPSDRLVEGMRVVVTELESAAAGAGSARR